MSQQRVLTVYWWGSAVHLNATTKAEVYQMQIDAYARVKELLVIPPPRSLLVLLVMPASTRNQWEPASPKNNFGHEIYYR